MINLNEIIQDYGKKRDDMINSITENFDKFYSGSHDDLEKILSFIKYSSKLIIALIEEQRTFETFSVIHQKRHESIDLIIAHYEIDKVFNRDKANKWLINALILVVRDDNTFDGVRFNKDGKSRLKSFIVKTQ